jgi:hypothetical protein
MTKTKIQKFKKDTLNVLSRTIKYLEDWYDYQESPFKLFSVLNLKESRLFRFEDLYIVILLFHIQSSMFEQRSYKNRTWNAILTKTLGVLHSFS